MNVRSRACSLAGSMKEVGMSGTARLGLLVNLVLAAPFFEIASSATAGPPAPVACNTTKGACWRPSLDDPWQYQLQPQANSANRNAISKTIDLYDTPWTPCR